MTPQPRRDTPAPTAPLPPTPPTPPETDGVGTKCVSHEKASLAAVTSNSTLFLVVRELDSGSGMEFFDIGASLEDVQEKARETHALIVVVPLLADYR